MTYLSKREENFDTKLAKDCAQAFAGSTELGTIVSLENGEIIAEYGNGCASCSICELAGKSKSQCFQSHAYGMKEAERFGGKYVYFCVMGLTCFVSPIVGKEKSEAKITVGPFLMVEKPDYINYELHSKFKLDQSQINSIHAEIDCLPYVSPEKVTDMSTLLFLSVGFINNVWAANNMLDTQLSYDVQNHMSLYISKLKGVEDLPPYPFDVETKLLEAIAQSNKDSAKRYLNELFGYIFFSTGNNLELAKSRTYELLVLISRTAIKNGADPEKSLILSHDYLQIIPKFQTLEELCTWLIKITDSFIDLFNYIDVKHANIIHKATLYIRQHYAEKITLENISKMVFLSPAYFSRIFKKEIGITFNSFLNNVRIEKSKDLLKNNKLKMVDIAFMVGFDSQSYFTKVFKKNIGVSPLQYRYKNNV